MDARFYAREDADGGVASPTARCCKPSSIVLTLCLLVTSAVLGSLQVGFADDESVPASATACDLFPAATDHIRAVSVILAVWACLFCCGVLSLGLCFRRGDCGSSLDAYPRASRLNVEFDGSTWLVGDEIEFYNTGSTPAALLRTAGVLSFAFLGITTASISSVWLSKW